MDVHVKTFNDNLKELQVIESKRNAIGKGLVYELLNAQEPVLCSFVRREWESEVTIRTKEVP